MDETQQEMARKDLEISALREELGQAINEKLELRKLIILLQEKSKVNVEPANNED